MGKIIVPCVKIGKIIGKIIAYNSDSNPGQPRRIMRIIGKIMHIIVQESSLRQLSTLYVCLPFDAVEQAFFTDTYKSYLHA